MKRGIAIVVVAFLALGVAWSDDSYDEYDFWYGAHTQKAARSASSLEQHDVDPSGDNPVDIALPAPDTVNLI